MVRLWRIDFILFMQIDGAKRFINFRSLLTFPVFLDMVSRIINNGPDYEALSGHKSGSTNIMTARITNVNNPPIFK